jgi:hypothetical protein
MSRHPVPLEGRIAIVTDVGAGCGGRGRRFDEGVCARTVKSCGPDASTLASSWWKSFPASDGGKKARSPGRSRINRKTIAWGMSGDPGDLAVNTRAHTHHPMRARGCGCAWHPAFPAPSIWRGRMLIAKLGCVAPREYNVTSVIARSVSDEAIYTRFAARWQDGLLHFARNDGVGCRRCLKIE